jgi:uncharacterized low-complexity protein
MKTKMKLTGKIASMMVAVFFTAITFEVNASAIANSNPAITKIAANDFDGDNTYFAKCDAAGAESKKTSDKSAPTARPATTSPTATPAATTPAAKPAAKTTDVKTDTKTTKEGKCGDGKCGDGKCGDSKSADEKEGASKSGAVSTEKKTSEGKCGTSKF